jgi:hypothetical protein
MTYWHGPPRWINGVLLAVLAVIVFDGLLRLLGGNAVNPIVGGVRAVAGVLLFPFAAMFAGQPHLVTIVLSVVSYVGLAVVLLAVVTGGEQPVALGEAPTTRGRPRRGEVHGKTARRR